MRITCLTPLHIGTGNEAPDFEYHLDAKSDILVRFSLARLLAQDPTVHSNPAMVSTPENLRKYLETASWRGFQLYALRGEAQAFWRECQAKAGVRLAPLAVRETSKTAYKLNPLLPGSSLKGALLTGWHFDKLWQKLAPDERNKLLDVADTSFAHDWSPFYRKQSYSAQRSGPPLDQILVELLDMLYNAKNPEWRQRLLGKLSDRLFIPDVELDGDMLIQRAQRSSRNADKALPQWIESVAAQATGKSPVRMNERETTLYSRRELCRRVNLFANAVLVAECQFFNYIEEAIPIVYQPQGEVSSAIGTAQQTDHTCIVRLGWGSNKNATSITLLNSAADLSRQPDDERRRPKTRWMTANDTPLGWCKVEFEEGDYVH